jgi:hypothetical protein
MQNIPGLGNVPMQGGGPVRMKKKPGLVQSVFGVFIGIALVLFSPYPMWLAGAQDFAGEYESATRVDATSGDDGYVVFDGAPSFVAAGDSAKCHAPECIYETESVQQLVTNQELVCGSVTESESTHILYQDGYEYDEDTDKTVPCYQVEKYTWEEQEFNEVINKVKVGAYTITPSSRAQFFETEEDIVEDEFNDSGKAMHRSVFTSFVMPTSLLVAGEAVAKNVGAPDENVYVLSAHNYDTTLVKLQDLDTQRKIMFMLAAFVMLFIGFMLIFGPIDWARRMLGRLPFAGRMLSEVSRAAIMGVSLLLSIVLWIVIWLVVTLVQVWWLGLIVLVLLGFGVWLLSKRKKE